MGDENEMQISLATPEKIVFKGTTEGIQVEAEKGQLQILPRHANLITLVKAGPLKIKTSASSQELRFDVGDGVLKVEDGRISVLCQEVRAA